MKNVTIAKEKIINCCSQFQKVDILGKMNYEIGSFIVKYLGGWRSGGLADETTNE